MTFIWLVVWLLSHTPQVQMFGAWNNWGIALAVCVVIDLTGSLGANASRTWRREDDELKGPGSTRVTG